MKAKLLLVPLVVPFVYACSYDEISLTSDAGDSNIVSRSVSDEAVKVEDGHLCFSTFEDLYAYIDSQKSDSNIRIYSTKPRNFQSLQMCVDRLDGGGGGSAPVLSTKEQEKLTALAIKADTLLIDPVLETVVDTTFSVAVNTNLYRITDYGTFITTNKNNTAELDACIRNFDKNKLIQVAEGLYRITDNVSIYDSYGYISGKNSTLDEYAVVPSTLSTTNAAFGDMSYNTKKYGLVTKQWKTHGLHAAFSWLVGKDISRDNNFDSKHKVHCELFQVNYLFYASTGFKVKMQEKHKILFFNRWKNINASDIVIGIERLSGHMKFNYNPGSIGKLPTYKTFTCTLQNMTNKMLYAGIGKPTFIEDWVNDTADMCYAALDNSPINKYIKEPWECTLPLTQEIFYKGLDKLTDQAIYNVIGKRLAPEDPRVALVFRKSGSLETHVRGLQSYGSRKSKTIYFSRSGGFSISLGGTVIGWIPEKYNIDGADIFGAIKYNGTWKGVRFHYK